MASGPPARTVDKLVCDVAADTALEAQDYPTAIDLHRKLLRLEKNNALAHYHLGFAYGMTGSVSKEISEYRTAISLGLNVWDLFLNLGLAYYDQRDLPSATAALGTSVLLGPSRRDPGVQRAELSHAKTPTERCQRNRRKREREAGLIGRDATATLRPRSGSRPSPSPL